MNLFNP